MPANAVTDLLRNILALPGGQAQSGVPEISRTRDDAPGRDFAGLLSDNLGAPPRDRPEPRPEPTGESAPPSKRPTKEREEAPADQPPSDVPPAQGDEAAGHPADVSEKSSTAASAEQPSTEKPTGEPAPENNAAQPRSQTPSGATSSAPMPVVTGAVQGGIFAVLEALFSTNTTTSEQANTTSEQPVGPHPSTPTNSPGQTIAPQAAAASLDALKTVLNIETSTKSQASEAPAPTAQPGETDANSAKASADSAANKVLATNAPEGRSAPQNAEAPRGLPVTQTPAPMASPTQEPAKTPLADITDRTSEPAVPQSAPTPQPVTPKPLIPIRRAVVIPEDPGAKSPSPNKGAGRLPTEAVPNDPAPALNMARLLLDAKITAAGTESSLQADQPAQQTQSAQAQTTTGVNSAGAPSQPGVTPTTASADTGGSSWDGSPANQPGARNLLVETGEARAETSPMEQVVRAARAQIGARHSQVRLQLQPPELGQLRIDVRMNGKNVQLIVQTQTEMTQQIISSRVSDLRTALETQGLTVERVHVELRGPNQTSSSTNQQDHSGIQNPLRDAHPDSHRGAHPESENDPDHQSSGRGTEGVSDNPDEEDSPSAAATDAGVNVIA